MWQFQEACVTEARCSGENAVCHTASAYKILCLQKDIFTLPIQQCTFCPGKNGRKKSVGEEWHQHISAHKLDIVFLVNVHNGLTPFQENRVKYSLQEILTCLWRQTTKSEVRKVHIGMMSSERKTFLNQPDIISLDG